MGINGEQKAVYADERLSNLALLQPSPMGCCRDLAKNSPSLEQFALAFVIRDKSVSLLFDNVLKQQLF